jgi:hypothetical protein
MDRKSPRGRTSLNVTVRLALFVATPAMFPRSVRENRSAPAKFRKKPTPWELPR